MNRRERIMRTMAGLPVDRPAVCFYEINGFTQNPGNPDPFYIYNDPSWQPLLQLAAEHSDRIAMLGAVTRHEGQDTSIVPPELVQFRTEEVGKRRYYHTSISAGKRTLTQVQQVDADVNTVWCTEHLIKDADDLRAWVELPETALKGSAFTDDFRRCEDGIGDTGAVLIDTGDPLCLVAGMMPMEEYTVVAMTERELFLRALEKAARYLLWNTEQVARALPGRIWRICGPEYASPPYLPPALFRDYVTAFDREMVQIILRSGGYPRIHCHGNIREILDDIVATGCTALDPIEPPPQGNVSLSYVREQYGDRLTLFGNLEASDLENLDAEAFRAKVRQALREGTAGSGRGFVLMPSACPYGRKLTARALRNYEVMVEESTKW